MEDGKEVRTVPSNSVICTELFIWRTFEEGCLIVAHSVTQVEGGCRSPLRIIVGEIYLVLSSDQVMRVVVSLNSFFPLREAKTWVL